jgi:hypothetical protein
MSHMWIKVVFARLFMNRLVHLEEVVLYTFVDTWFVSRHTSMRVHLWINIHLLFWELRLGLSSNKEGAQPLVPIFGWLLQLTPLFYHCSFGYSS